MTKNIKNVAPLLADHFIDIESDMKLVLINEKLIRDNAQRLGLYYKYLGLLHDSWLIKATIDSDKYSITLNDFTTHVFSDVIVDKKKLDIGHDKLVFPMQLDFEITKLTFNTVDENGDMEEIEPISFNEYLYEQIISIAKDVIEIGLVVWNDGINEEPGQQILIIMSAKNITLTELQEKAWTEIFGELYAPYYKYFKAQLDTGRYLSDQSKCNELYDEYEANISANGQLL